MIKANHPYEMIPKPEKRYLTLNIALYRKWQRRVRRILLLTRVSYSGLQDLPSTGPFILAPNHLNWKDILFVGGTVERPVSFVATERLFIKRLCRQMLQEYFDPYLRVACVHRLARRGYEGLAHFLVERVRRSGAFPASLELFEMNLIDGIKRAVMAGKGVCIFPEGRTAPPGRLRRFKLGLPHALYELHTENGHNVPVYPVGISGTQSFLHPGMALSFRISNPIYIRDYLLDGKRETLLAFSRELQIRVASLLRHESISTR